MIIVGKSVGSDEVYNVEARCVIEPNDRVVIRKRVDRSDEARYSASIDVISIESTALRQIFLTEDDFVALYTALGEMGRSLGWIYNE